MAYKRVKDQMHREVEVPLTPQRIVSLVPSQTELLYDLGLNAEIVGQTLFCVHPEYAHLTKPRVGGTKQFKMEVITRLNPDLIIGNKEENEQQQIELLMQKYPVWMSDITQLTEALEMIRNVGELVGRPKQALSICRNIEVGFEALDNTSLKGKRVLYFIWRNPWMVAGKHTFIDDMLSKMGLVNVAGNRYPELSVAQIEDLKPDILLFSSEPFPFKNKHMDELLIYCPAAKYALVDGELFSWYGSRLTKSVTYFNQLIAELKD